jgi:transposase
LTGRAFLSTNAAISSKGAEHYRAEDAVAEAYAMVFLVQSGFAQQTEVARAFARSVRSVRRYQRHYAQGGMAALGREQGWRRGRRRISGKRLHSIDLLKSQGMSNRTIAHRLGVSERRSASWSHLRSLLRPLSLRSPVSRAQRQVSRCRLACLLQRQLAMTWIVRRSRHMTGPAILSPLLWMTMSRCR